MNEANITRALTIIMTAVVIWFGSTVVEINKATAAQEVQIQVLVKADNDMASQHASTRERIAAVEAEMSGLSASLDALKEGQNRILNKLEGR